MICGSLHAYVYHTGVHSCRLNSAMHTASTAIGHGWVHIWHPPIPYTCMLPLRTLLLFFQCALRWSIAVSTICRHSSRVVAFLQAVARPKFRGSRCASIALSQAWLGLPAGRFQLGGTCRIHASNSAARLSRKVRIFAGAVYWTKRAACNEVIAVLVLHESMHYFTKTTAQWLVLLGAGYKNSNLLKNDLHISAHSDLWPESCSGRGQHRWSITVSALYAVPTASWWLEWETDRWTGVTRNVAS